LPTDNKLHDRRSILSGSLQHIKRIGLVVRANALKRGGKGADRVLDVRKQFLGEHLKKFLWWQEPVLEKLPIRVVVKKQPQRTHKK